VQPLRAARRVLDEGGELRAVLRKLGHTALAYGGREEPGNQGGYLNRGAH
jgi:hypothetical protein